MTDDTVRLSMVGLILRRRWRLLVALTVLGGLLGAGASTLFGGGYETSTRVLLQGPRDSDELLTEAQVAMSSVVLGRTAAALGWNVSGVDLQESVTAGVADGNVIMITASAETPERAQQLADRVATEYIVFSTELVTNASGTSGQALREQREALRQQIAGTNDRITELYNAMQSSTIDGVRLGAELEALRSSLSDAMDELEKVDTGGGPSKLVVMGQAELPSSRAARTLLNYTGGGALLFLLLGVFGHLVAARADRRLRSEPEIEAALDAPVLVVVDVPVEPEDAPVSLGTRLRRLVLGDRPWNQPLLPGSADEAGRDIRYRRVLARLRAGAGFRNGALVVVPDDDATARQAAERLAATAGADPGGPDLRVFGVPPGRPTVPDGGDGSGAVVVLTAGTRTAWELDRIAQSCADAGRRLLGAVVAYPSRPADHGDRHDRHREEPAGEDGPPAAVSRHVLTGPA